MGAGTAEKPVTAAEKKAAAKSNGKGAVNEAHAHAALGTLGTDIQSDPGPQDVHAGDPDETADVPQSASGAPVALTFDVGGKKPTAAQVRIVGGKVDVPGQYRKGQVVEFRICVKFGEVAFVDLEDKETGQVIGCDRRQKGRIVEIAELG